MKTGVYQIRNLVNHKVYIGSAASQGGFRERWNNHQSALRRQDHRNTHLQRAWNKYGKSAFVFEILEKCGPQFCLEREQHYLDTI